MAVDEVDANDAELSDFHAFITKMEEQKIGYNGGVFKVRIDASSRDGMELPGCILERLSPGKEVISQIVLRRRAPEIYIYKKEAASEDEKHSFQEDALKALSYSMESCCSKILAEEGLDKLMEHLFKDIVEATSVRDCLSEESVTAQMDRLLKRGVELQLQFENNCSDLFDRKRRGVHRCPCVECEGLATSQENSETAVHSLEPASKHPKLYDAGIHSYSPVYITEHFSLSKLKNILLVMGRSYKGITSPFCYVGKEHSFFPLHIEDGSLWSINFLHFGHIKLWIVIPPHAFLLLMLHLRRCGVSLGNSSCWNALGHKTILVTIKWLQDRGIPFEVVLQRPGEAVILYPNAAHFGFNLGWNCAEAINFGTPSWIPQGINAPKCLCLTKAQVHLDLTDIIATFAPHLLEKHSNGEMVVNSETIKMADFLQQSLKNTYGPSRSVKTKHLTAGQQVPCPMLSCSRRYPKDKKTRMVPHVLQEHKPVVSKLKLLQAVDEAYARP